MTLTCSDPRYLVLLRYRVDSSAYNVLCLYHGSNSVNLKSNSLIRITMRTLVIPILGLKGIPLSTLRCLLLSTSTELKLILRALQAHDHNVEAVVLPFDGQLSATTSHDDTDNNSSARRHQSPRIKHGHSS